MGRYINSKRPIVEINNKLYLICAEYPYEKIKDVTLVRKWLGVDNVFKSHKTGTYLFCEEIEDIEWEDIT